MLFKFFFTSYIFVINNSHWYIGEISDNIIKILYSFVCSVIGESAVDMTPVLYNLNIPGTFKEFVTQNFTDWTYFKFSPVTESHSTASPEKMPAVTLALMLLSGTPVLQVGRGSRVFLQNI